MRVAIIADPAEKLKLATDTTLLIAGECNRRGHEVYYAVPQKLVLTNNGPKATWHRFDYALNDTRSPQDCLGEAMVTDTSQFDIVLMRQDPPVNEAYIAITQMLDFSKTPVINNPRDVCTFSEKISVLYLPDCCPPSIVAIDPDEIQQFVAQFPDGCVLKPLNEFGGRGVVRLKSSDPDIVEVIRRGTHDFTKYVIVQRFVAAVAEGDKRIFLLDGKPIGRVNRIPNSGEWRANIHLGAKPAQFTLTQRDQEIVDSVARLLSRYDLPVTCIDVIGEYLTEINVTSPSGIPYINRVYGPGHEQPIVDYLEQRVMV